MSGAQDRQRKMEHDDTRPPGTIKGCALREATRSFFDRQPETADDHARPGPNGLILSSIGLGTGGFDIASPDVPLEQLMDTVQAALQNGVNVIDTAINYGWQTTERIIGHALAREVSGGRIAREEVVIVTKGGYLPYTPEQFERRFIATDRCAVEDVVGGMHCLHPAFLRDQIDESRRNLGVAVIDVYLVHNPEEQLQHLDPSTFRHRMLAAYEVLEEAVAAGHIVCYGVASAEGFRPTAPVRHELGELVTWATEVGGSTHGFKVVELPINAAAPEAAIEPTEHAEGRVVPLLTRAAELGVSVLASVPLGNGRLPPAALKQCREQFGLESDVLCALQFVRSLPMVTTCLVGMSRPRHVTSNLSVRLRSCDPMASETMLSVGGEL